MSEKATLYVHTELVAELKARRNGLQQEKAVLSRAAQRIAEIDATIAALDGEIARSEGIAEPILQKQRAEDEKSLKERK